MKLNLFFALVFSIVVLNACTNAKKNDVAFSPAPPSSQEVIDPGLLASREPQGVSSDPSEMVKMVVNLPSSPDLNAGNCSAKIDPILQMLLGMKTTVLNQVGKTPVEKKKILSDWLVALFEARNKMRSRVSDLAVKGPSDPCVKSIRRYLVYIRFAEELISETLIEKKFYPFSDDGPAFGPGFPATLVSAKFKGQPRFKAGDVMLDRGDSAISAQIARVGEVEHFYSHIMLVGADQKGALYVIDATPEHAVSVVPLKEYLTESNDSRMAVFRYPDETLAMKAGRFMYDHVQRADAGDGLPYDFAMNEKDSSEFFCSEIAQFAYDKASGGKVHLPLFKTDVSRFEKMGKAHNWVHQMSINDNFIFSASDMDVDPRFELVVEYRNLSETRGRRLDDAVMSSLFRFMLNQGYYFMDPLAVDILAGGAKIFAKGFIPDNIPTSVMTAAIQFEEAFIPLRNNLELVEEKFFKMNGVSMSFQQMLDANESFRVDDCRRYEERYTSLADGSDGTGSAGPYQTQNFFHAAMSSDRPAATRCLRSR